MATAGYHFVLDVFSHIHEYGGLWSNPVGNTENSMAMSPDIS